MKLIFAILALATTVASAQDVWKPEHPPIDRYATLWARNPFTLTTSPGSQAGFARDLSLAGISKIGNDIMVLAVNSKTRTYIKLDKTANADGIRVLEILSPQDRNTAKVRIAQGEVEATLTYDLSAIATATVSDAKPQSAPKTDSDEANKRLKIRLPDRSNQDKQTVKPGEETDVRKNRMLPKKWNS